MRSELTQARSKLLFGQAHRLALMIAIANAPDGRVNPTDLSRELGLAQSAFQKPLRDLLEAGLVAHELSLRRNVYVKQPSLVWDWVAELDTQIQSEAQERARAQLVEARRLRSPA